MSLLPFASSLLQLMGQVGLILTLLLVASAVFFRFMVRASERKAAAYQPRSLPLYTVDEKPSVNPGWYPTPAGDQDRYHDGRGWTDHFRPRTEAGLVDDPAPDGVIPEQPVWPGEEKASE